MNVHRYAQIDIRAFDMPSAAMRLSRGGGALLLDVPGLAEGRPSVLRGDSVVARVGTERQYRGVVHEVHLETIHLRFDRQFHHAFVPGMRHAIRFTLRRSAMLLMHAAVAARHDRGDDRGDRNETELPPALLFPSAALPCAAGDAACAAARAAVERRRLPAPLHNCRLNERQVLAVRGALCSAGADGLPAELAGVPYVIYGPPGTGKTSTVAEYVLQVGLLPILSFPKRNYTMLLR